MNILALDLGTNTGWAANRGEFYSHGVSNLKGCRDDSPGMKFLRFESWLCRFIPLFAPGLIIFEKPHLRGGAATDALVGYQTIVHKVAADKGINVTALHTATLKKFATNNGRASKEDMIRAAQVRFDYDKPLGSDEADAMNLLSYALKKFGEGKSC